MRAVLISRDYENCYLVTTSLFTIFITAWPDTGEDGVHACVDAGTPMDVNLAEDATVTDVEHEGSTPPKLPEPTNPPASPPIHSQSSPQSPHMALPSNGHASVLKPHSSSLSPS